MWGLPKRLRLIIINGLIFGILSHDRSGAVHSPRDLSSARGRAALSRRAAFGAIRRSGGLMVGVLRAVARFFQETIGWNRIGVMLSIAIISVAVVVLFHMLRDTDVDEVVAALKATSPAHIAAAAFFVACGYFTLTFYDWFALRLSL